MTEIKITAKKDSNERVYIKGLSHITCLRFTSQEMDNGIPKYQILIPYEHPELEKQEKEKIDVETRINNRQFGGYCYEISFVESEILPYIPSNGATPEHEDRNKKVFNLQSNITIKDNSYEKILEDLKKESNLMKEEETIWKGFIGWVRGELAGISDKNSTKYKEGRKFIEDLEAEFNKKTGKGNDDDRERERERESRIEGLRRRIEVLEAIINRTPQEEQELKNKKQELAELEKQQSQEPKKTNWTPWLIGGGIILILVIGIIVYLWGKKSSKE